MVRSWEEVNGGVSGRLETGDVREMEDGVIRVSSDAARREQVVVRKDIPNGEEVRFYRL